MPQYVATLAYNQRHYSQWEFEAQDDEAARARLRQRYQEGNIPWETGDDAGDADAEDPVLHLDRCIQGSARREEVESEIELPGFVYFNDLTAFAQKVAGLASADQDAGGALAALIVEARAILKGAESF